MCWADISFLNVKALLLFGRRNVPPVRGSQERGRSLRLITHSVEGSLSFSFSPWEKQGWCLGQLQLRTAKHEVPVNCLEQIFPSVTGNPGRVCSVGLGGLS